MTKLSYLAYLKAKATRYLLGSFVWNALATFTLTAKAQIGIENLPVFDIAIFMAGLIAVKMAYGNKKLSLKTIEFVDNGIESVFIIALLTMTAMGTELSYMGMTVLAVVFLSTFLKEMRTEVTRSYEIRKYTLFQEEALKLVRKIIANNKLIGGGLGSVVALVCLKYLQMDLNTFATILLMVNVVYNVQLHIAIYKYL